MGWRFLRGAKTHAHHRDRRQAETSRCVPYLSMKSHYIGTLGMRCFAHLRRYCTLNIRRKHFAQKWFKIVDL